MHLVEKIGNLVLVTLEDEIRVGEITEIKRQLRELSEEDGDAVVSLNISNPDGSEVPVKEEAKRGYHDIIAFCKESDIRIYSVMLE